MPSRFRFLRPLLTLVVVLGLLSSQAPGKKSAGNSASISEEELRAKVQVMADSFSGQLGSLSLRVSADTADNDIRRAVLFLKMRVITIIEAAVDNPSAMTAYLDLWSLAFQMEVFFENGMEVENATSALGEFRPEYIKFFKNIHGSFETTAASFLPPESLKQAILGVDEYVRNFTIAGEGANVTRISFSDTAVGGMLGGVMSLPMAPFRAMEGVGKGGDAAESLVTVANRFTTVVERMPEHIGWQLEMLMLDGRRDVNELLTQSNEQMAAVQTALEQVQAALKDVQVIGSQAETVTTSVERTVTALDTSAGSLDTLLKTYKDTMMTLYPPATPEEKARLAAEKAAQPETPSKPFDINDYTTALAGLTAASAELKLLLVELQTTLDGDSFERVIEGAGKVTSVALQESTQSVDGIIDRTFRRALQVLFVAFGLAVVFLILTRWVIRKKAA